MRWILLIVLIPCAALFAGDAPDAAALRRAVTLYASFDEAVKADAGGGTLSLSTRHNNPKEKGKFIFTKGHPEKAFRIANDKGVQGGALESIDVLPANGRIFFHARGNIAYKVGGWSGAVSMWIKTDPDKLLKTRFCDPVQITQKGAQDGGIWFDFNHAKPRDLRMGVFPAVPPGKKPVPESSVEAPMVWVRKVGFRADDWHHVVLSWRNLDTGKNDAVVALWIDGKRIGEVKDRPLAMAWDMDHAGIYVAVNFIGLIDEFAVFKGAPRRDQLLPLLGALDVVEGQHIDVVGPQSGQHRPEFLGRPRPGAVAELDADDDRIAPAAQGANGVADRVRSAGGVSLAGPVEEVETALDRVQHIVGRQARFAARGQAQPAHRLAEGAGRTVQEGICGLVAFIFGSRAAFASPETVL